MATDGGSNRLTGHTTLHVEVLDVNDNPPQVTINTLTVQTDRAEISENSPVGTFVGFLSVFDADSNDNGNVDCRLIEQGDRKPSMIGRLRSGLATPPTFEYAPPTVGYVPPTYNFAPPALNNTPSTSNGVMNHFNSPLPTFKLQKLSNEQFTIYTNLVLDYEFKTTYLVSIDCNDGGVPSLHGTASLFVDVVDQNDNPPIFASTNYNISIKEGNFPDVLLANVAASDRDSGRFSEISFAILESISGDVYINSRSGEIRASGVFDYERMRRLTFHVLATDGGDPSLSALASITINILDANDNPPQFTQPNYIFNICENSLPGSLIGQLNATDVDSAPFDRFSFMLSKTRNRNSIGRIFYVDPSSGTIRSNISFDRESNDSYTFVVSAVDATTSALSSDAIVVVYVTDVNDNPPVIEFPSMDSFRFNLSNRVPIGHSVMRVQASDADFGPNARLAFSLSNLEQGIFEIDNSTGILTTRFDLSFISDGRFYFTIVVRDSGNPSMTSSVDVVIHVDSLYEYTLDANVLGPLQNHNNNNSRVKNLVVLVVVSFSGIVTVVLVALILLLKVRYKRNDSLEHLSRVYRCRIEEERIFRCSSYLQRLSANATEHCSVVSLSGLSGGCEAGKFASGGCESEHITSGSRLWNQQEVRI